MINMKFVCMIIDKTCTAIELAQYLKKIMTTFLYNIHRCLSWMKIDDFVKRIIDLSSMVAWVIKSFF